jgi:uncharacterized membrane protein YqjE
VALAVHPPDSSLGERLRDGREEWNDLRNEATGIASELGQVARDEARLAVAEVRDGVRTTVRAMIMGAVAGALAVVTLMWLPLPLLIGLAEVMPWWAASLITVGVLLAVTAFVGLLALQQFKAISFVPKGAMERFKEDKEWVTQQLSRKPS